MVESGRGGWMIGGKEIKNGRKAREERRIHTLVTKVGIFHDISTKKTILRLCCFIKTMNMPT